MKIISNKNRELLNTAGMKATSQRALILDVIRQREKHLDADEVYRRARKKDPNLSLSTVYRTLRLFKKMGLVEELHFDEARHHYEASPSEEHHHLVCLGCGQVIDFDSPLIAEAAAEMQRENGFDITSVQLKLEGYCPKCKQKED